MSLNHYRSGLYSLLRCAYSTHSIHDPLAKAPIQSFYFIALAESFLKRSCFFKNHEISYSIFCKIVKKDPNEVFGQSNKNKQKFVEVLTQRLKVIPL